MRSFQICAQITYCRCRAINIFRIYIFRDCIICEKEYDCGGFAGSRCFDITLFTMKEIWDEIIEYIKGNID